MNLRTYRNTNVRGARLAFTPQILMVTSLLKTCPVTTVRSSSRTRRGSAKMPDGRADRHEGTFEGS
jgi:hypothetical protein